MKYKMPIEQDTKEERSNLKALLEFEKEIIENEGSRELNFDEKGELYSKIIDGLDKISFNEEDLRSMISQKICSSEYRDDYNRKERKVFGLYTGCLLHLLTERNEKLGKGTRFYINGYSNRADYLFYMAKKVDELIVDNFVGEEICSMIANQGGQANLVALINNHGGEIFASDIGAREGKVGLVVAINNEGRIALSSLGAHRGEVGLVVAAYNKQGALVDGVGDWDGEVGMVVLIDNKAKAIGRRFDIEAQSGLEKVVKVGLMVALSPRKYDYQRVAWGSDTKGISLVIRDKEELKENLGKLEEYKVREVISLTNSLKNKDSEKVVKGIDKIYEIYKSVEKAIKNLTYPLGTATETIKEINLLFPLGVVRL